MSLSWWVEILLVVAGVAILVISLRAARRQREDPPDDIYPIW